MIMVTKLNRARPLPPPGPYLVVGLGRAGSSAANALAGLGEPVVAWDASETRGSAGADRLEDRGVRVELGGSGLTALNAAGGSPTVVKSPGVPFDAPLMRVARRRRLTVIDELELGWRMGSAPLVGVTGTNGKSTTAMLIATILESAGLRAPVVGNADYGQPLTAAPADADVLVCEVSSYQLEGCPAFVPEMAVFTNLTHDHLHRHGSLRRYGELKRRMFVRGDSATTVGVLNVDDPLGHRLAHDLGTAAGARVIGYGTNPAATYRIESCEWTAHAGQVTLAAPAGRLVVESALTGEHNARNTAAALATAAALGVDVDVAAGAVARARPLPGRFEPVVDAPFDVIVDNAGNPDAITACLGTARGIADQRRGRVHAVIGPGGGILDLEKRRAGARAACALADRIVMSSAGSFGQWLSPPLLAAVGAAREAGGGKLEVILDRREAIRDALAGAEPGDVVVILGRGPRPMLDGVPLDDRVVAREAVADLALVGANA